MVVNLVTPNEAVKQIEDKGRPVQRERYQRLIDNLTYLSHTRHDIAFAVSVASPYMHSTKERNVN